jgi:hypothetical protein
LHIEQYHAWSYERQSIGIFDLFTPFSEAIFRSKEQANFYR